MNFVERCITKWGSLRDTKNHVTPRIVKDIRDKQFKTIRMSRLLEHRLNMENVAVGGAFYNHELYGYRMFMGMRVVLDDEIDEYLLQ